MRTTCPDCNTQLSWIHVSTNTGLRQHGLPYVESGTQYNSWKGYPVSGSVDAGMCPSCQRVVFYARPGR